MMALENLPVDDFMEPLKREKCSWSNASRVCRRGGGVRLGGRLFWQGGTPFFFILLLIPTLQHVTQLGIPPWVACMLNIESFYDELASGYDAMTDFEHRFERESGFFEPLIGTNHVTAALDAGTGTGFHALLLARLGVRVTAVDVSGAMISRLLDHAREYHLNVTALQLSFRSLTNRFPSAFDAIVCMGNTLAHGESVGELQATFREFAAMLRRPGLVILQIVNFEKMLRGLEPYCKVRKTAAGSVTRTYSITETGIRFTIEHRNQHDNLITQRSLDMQPFTHFDIVASLESAGFNQVDLFGNIFLEQFDPMKSGDLIAIARLPV